MLCSSCVIVRFPNLLSQMFQKFHRKLNRWIAVPRKCHNAHSYPQRDKEELQKMHEIERKIEEGKGGLTHTKKSVQHVCVCVFVCVCVCVRARTCACWCSRAVALFLSSFSLLNARALSPSHTHTQRFGGYQNVSSRSYTHQIPCACAAQSLSCMPLFVAGKHAVRVNTPRRMSMIIITRISNNQSTSTILSGQTSTEIANSTSLSFAQ